MDYYLLNRQELLPKAKDRYYNGGGKEKAAKYYLENKKVLQENSKNKYKNVSEEKKNQKDIIEEIDLKALQKIKKQAKRILKKLSGIKIIN